MEEEVDEADCYINIAQKAFLKNYNKYISNLGFAFQASQNSWKKFRNI